MRREQLVAALGLKRASVPCHNTFRRVLQEAVNERELQQVTTAYLQASQDEPEGRQLIAVDGKTLRGTIPTGASRGVHLLAAYVPAEGLVLMQVAVDKKENEIVAAPRLLAALDLRHKVICGDALLTQRELSIQILAGGGDYLWLAKDNQPALLADIHEVFEPAPTAPGWSQAPRDWRVAQTVESGHGRLEKRRLTASSFLADYGAWPGLAQVFQLERQVTSLATGETYQEVSYGLTSLTAAEASAAQLLAYIRDYWGIENGLHYRRDKTLQEDATRMNHPQQARVLAVLNNFVVGFCKRCGFDNLAQARRYFGASINKALVLAAYPRM